MSDAGALPGLRRYIDLQLSPDGSRLVLTRSEPNADESAYIHTQWEIDPSGREPAQRLHGFADGSATVMWPAVGRAMSEYGDLSPDGRTLVAVWNRPDDTVDGGRDELVAMDLDAPGVAPRPLIGRVGCGYTDPVVSPDGRFVVCQRIRFPTAGSAWTVRLELVELGSGRSWGLTDELDPSVGDLRWSASGDRVFFTADEAGRHPLYSVDVEVNTDLGGESGDELKVESVQTGSVRRIVGDAAYRCPAPAPDGRTVYALRHAVDVPPEPVRIRFDPTGRVEPTVESLPGPEPRPDLPGEVTELTARADDGTPLRAWLVLPARPAGRAESGNAAPLLVAVHGGPHMSWAGWIEEPVAAPWVAAARGYAMLLPDPAMSSGYGESFLDRGRADWGLEAYTDLLALTEACLKLPAIDPDRVALVGHSFGGWMAGRVARRDRSPDVGDVPSGTARGAAVRFAAIVAHAGWVRSSDPAPAGGGTDPYTVAPVLVLHGGCDPVIGADGGADLWRALQSGPAARADRFVFFPGEGHGFDSPARARDAHRAVYAFLAEALSS